MSELEPREGWVDNAGVRLHYWDWPGAEPAMLCMHGITANGRYWDSLAEQLNGRQRLIAVDLRGRGLSDKPPAGQYGWDQHAADMAAVLRALELGSAIAVGHSLGGYVATLLAAREPGLISRLVVVDAGIGLDQTTVRAQIAASLKRLKMVFPSREAYFDYWRQVPFILWTTAFECYLLAEIEERADGSVVVRTFAEAVEEDLLYFFEPGRAAAFAQAARDVQAPALVFWAPDGLADPQQPLMSRAGIEGLVDLLPRGRMLPVAGTNHYTILRSEERRVGKE